MTHVEVNAIYRALPVDSAVVPALVLVTGLLDADQLVAVTLLSPDTQLGGNEDLLLSPAESGLDYEVLVESDIFGYVGADQLDRRLGHVGPDTIGSLVALHNDDVVGRPVAGPPILTPADPRWAFKLAELRRLKGLGRHEGSCSNG